jgi:hypothetical protein
MLLIARLQAGPNLMVELQSCGDSFKVLLFPREHYHSKAIAPDDQIGLEPA